MNNLFHLFSNTNVCNIADDTTPYACNKDLELLLHDLESDVISAIIWFESNYMKINEDKSHFLFPGSDPELMWVKVGQEKIYESNQEKLLGLMIDKKLSFTPYLENLCRKVNTKITALRRLVRILPFEKRRILMNVFIESQFSYCPLIWMFCSREMNTKINTIHERALRLVYHDYDLSFSELLKKDKSITIHQRNIQKVATEMFKVKNNLSPEFMKDLFSLKPIHSNTDSDFVRAKTNKVKTGDMSLRVFGPIVWNDMIPNFLKEIENLSDFKEKISSWVPDNCPCRLCKILDLLI